jgi:hypothetical protein
LRGRELGRSIQACVDPEWDAFDPAADPPEPVVL